jgi:hypothetical protein
VRTPRPSAHGRWAWLAFIAAAILGACGGRTPVDEQGPLNDAGGPLGRDDSGTHDARADACAAGPCDAPSTVYVVANGIHAIDMRTFATRLIGSPFLIATTLALGPDDRLYAVSGSHLVYLDRTTGKAVDGPAVPLAVTQAMNALVAGDGDLLYAGAGQSVYSVDRFSGESHEVAPFPSPYRSSGDLAFVGGVLYGIGTIGIGQGDDTFIAFDLEAHSSRVIGTTGMHCVYGLATALGALYAFTCTGDVATVDLASGKTTKIAHVSLSINDAASR